MNSIWNLFWLLFSLCFVQKNCEIFNETEEVELEGIVESLMKCKNFPGIGISITKGYETFARGYGYADVEKSTPFTNRTLSCIASVTKSLTAALIGVLITENNTNGGSMSWDTKLREIFGPDFTLTSDPVRSSETTLRDILSHRAGITTMVGLLQSQYLSIGNYKESVLERMKYIPPAGLFRDKFLYNNFMYMLAGLAAEKIGGKPFYDLLREKLLYPLDIRSVVDVDDLDFESNMTSKPYLYINKTLSDSPKEIYKLGMFAPAGGICISSEDMAKWIRFIHSYGRTASGVRLINSLLFVDIVSPQIKLDLLYQSSLSLLNPFPVTSSATWYGMGFFGSIYRGSLRLFHSGSLYSYSSLEVIDFSHMSGFSIVVSGPYPLNAMEDIFPISYYLTDIVTGQDKWLNESTICTYPEPWTKKYNFPTFISELKNRTVENADMYVGVYGHRLFGDVHISKINESLYVRWGGMLRGFLHDLKTASTLRLKIDGPYAVVAGYEAGEVQLTFSEINDSVFSKLRMSFSKTFEKYDFKRGVSFHEQENSPTSTSDILRSKGLNIYLTFIFVFYFSYPHS